MTTQQLTDFIFYQAAQVSKNEQQDNDFSNAVRFTALLKAAAALLKSQVDVTNVQEAKESNVGYISKAISQSIIKQSQYVYQAYKKYEKEIKDINKLSKKLMEVGIAVAIVSVAMMAFVGYGAVIMALVIVVVATIPMKKTTDSNGIDHYNTALDLGVQKTGVKNETALFFMKLAILIGLSCIGGASAGAIDGTLAARSATAAEEEVATEMINMAEEEAETVEESTAKIMQKEMSQVMDKDATSLSATKKDLFKTAFIKSGVETGVFYASTLLGSLNPFQDLFQACGMKEQDAMYLSMFINIVLEVGMMYGIYKTAGMESAAPSASMQSLSGRVVMRTLLATNILLNFMTSIYQFQQSKAYNKLADTTDEQADLQKIAVILKGTQATVQTLEDDMSQAYHQLSAGAKSQTEGFSQWFGEDQAMANILGRFN